MENAAQIYDGKVSNDEDKNNAKNNFQKLSGISHERKNDESFGNSKKHNKIVLDKNMHETYSANGKTNENFDPNKCDKSKDLDGKIFQYELKQLHKIRSRFYDCDALLETLI